MAPESNPEKTTELFIEHYEQLSQKIGLEIVPPEFDFYLLAYILDSRKHIDEKIELLKKCKEFYPEAENADAYLGRTYYMIGDLQNAERYNDYALILNPRNEFAKHTKGLIEKKKNNTKQLAVSALSSISSSIKSSCNLTGKCFEMPNVSYT